MGDDPFGKPSEDEDSFEADLGEDEDRSFRITAGKYIAAVVDLEQGYSGAGNPMWTWVFRILDGEFEGKEFKLFTAITPAAMWKLRETVVALGLGEAGGKAKFKKDEAIGRMAIIMLVDDEYQDVKRSSIDKVLPHPDGAGTKYAPKAEGQP